MSEGDDVREMLGEMGVLDAFRWAYDAAASRVQEDYSEDAGHDTAWFGYTRFKLLCDRLDRVFSCGRYAVPDHLDGRTSLDVVHAELSQREIDTMPVVLPRVVGRSNLNQSPGWVVGDMRLLVHSIPPGKDADRLSWPPRRPTKWRVAQQPSSDSGAQTLFDALGDEDQIDGAVLFDQTIALDVRTFVVAHALNPVTGARELVLGHPRLNDGGGRPWHWTHDLLRLPPADGDRLRPARSTPSQSDGVPDAPVKLRRRAGEAGTEGAAK